MTYISDATRAHQAVLAAKCVLLAIPYQYIRERVAGSLLLASFGPLIGPGLYLYKFDRKSTAPETAAKFVQVSRARVPVMQICMYLHAFYVRNYHSRPENAT